MINQRIEMTELADFVYKRMEELGLSIRNVSDRMEVSHSTLLDYLSEEFTGHKIATLALLAKAVEVDLCTIVTIMKPDETAQNRKIIEIADRLAHLTPAQLERFDNDLIAIAFKTRKAKK